MQNLHGAQWLASLGATLASNAGRVSLAVLLVVAIAALLVLRRVRRVIAGERLAKIRAERQTVLANALQELTSALSRARTPHDVAAQVLPEVLHAMNAASGALVDVDPDAQTGSVVKAIGCGDATSSTAAFPLAAYPVVASALDRHKMARLEAGPTDAVGHAAIDALARQPLTMVVPLVTGNRLTGFMAVGFSDRATLCADDHEFLLLAARRTADALVRAGAYETAERARADAEQLKARADQELRERQKAEAALRESETKYRSLAARTSRLYAFSAALSESLTVDAVAAAVVRHGKVVVGASAGSVALLDDDRRLFETLKGDDDAGQPPESLRRFPAERGFCATAAVDTREPVFVSTFAESQRTFWRSASVAADGGFASAAVLPLIVKDAAIGVVTFHFTAPVHFDDDFKALLISVAEHCSQAIDRAQLYESAQRARMDAELANRSKDEFLSTVSHELRTPLTAVLGWAAMLRNGQVEPSRLQRAVEAIYSNATRQTQLIDELLDISRIVGGRAVLDLQELDLSATLRGSVEAIMPTAVAKGVELFIGHCPPVFVTADPRRLEQILLNLLANAVKFTPRDGRVTITMNVHDSSVDVAIADTGIGIAPQFLPFVFERFRQGEQSTARTAGGLGLGLFIARQLAEAQNGTITARSAGPGSGSTFTVSFPVVAAPMPRRSAWKDGGAEPAIHAETTRHSLTGVRVLLVDDDADIRELMVATLEAADADVTAAGSADEALDVLEQREVDVLLADIAMPERDGYDLIRAVRSTPSPRISRMPAAAVTACARDDERLRALSAGFQLHIPKPVDPEALVKAVVSLVSTANAGRA